MGMIQNAAMFQGVTQFASVPSGRMPVLALRSSEKGGAFAQLLQGRQSGGDDAADAGTAGGSPAVAGGENATGGTALVSVNGQNKEESADLQKAQLAPGETGSVGGKAASPEQAKISDGGAGSALQIKVSDGNLIRSGLWSKNLAAKPQLNGPDAGTVAQGKAASGASSTGSQLAKPTSGKATGGEEVGSHLECNSLAAGAQEIAAATLTGGALQLGLAGATMVTAGNAAALISPITSDQQEIQATVASADVALAKMPAGGTAKQPAGEEPTAADPGRTGNDPAAQSVPEKAATATGSGQEMTRFSSLPSATSQEAGSALPQIAQGSPAAPAANAVPAATAHATATAVTEASVTAAPVTAASAAPAEGTIARDASKATVMNGQQQGGAAAPAARSGGITAERFVRTPVAGPSFHATAAAPARGAGLSEEDSAKVAGPDGTSQSTAVSATEVAQQDVAGLGGKLSVSTGADSAAGQQATNPEIDRAGAAPGAQVSADKKDARPADQAHALPIAEKGLMEQTGVAPKVSGEEVSGIKTASAAAAAKFVPVQGNAGQGGSGDLGKKEHQEQKAQDSDGAQVQPLGLGVHTPAVAEAVQPEAKPVNLKSALHESILSQVKDGTVTHDGKGTSQMSIRLNPGELGELKIQVRMENNQLRVDVQAENRMVKDLLMSNLDTLKGALANKNFSMEGFDVSTGGGGFNSPLKEDNGSARQQSMQRTAKAVGYTGQDEGRVNYLTEEVNNLLDVRF